MPDILSNDDLNALAAEYVLGTLDYEERKGASALLEVDHAFRGVVRIWEKRFGELHLMVESVQPDPNLWERIRPKIAGVEQVSAAIPSVPAEPAAEGVAAESSPPLDGATPSAEPAADATAEAELKLAELAALLPVAAEPVAPGAPAEQTPPDDPQVRPAEEIPRGFVPPAPMIRRSTPPVVVPVRKASGGWIATSLAMGLVAVMLAGLISAWRFFPERLPEQLRAYTVLKIALPTPVPPPAPPRPQLPAFDE